MRRSGSAPPIRLTDSQRIAWLRLIRTDKVGPATFRQLLNHCGSAEAALERLPELARRGGGRIGRIPGVAEAEAELAAVRRAGARMVAPGEEGYPLLLAHIDGPPPLLTVRGHIAAFARHAVGIVGSRNASLAGIKMAALLAREIGRAGYTIASGLARGIDSAAHKASLGTGTIAVLAGGIDHVYPPENADLAAVLCETGGLLTEMPFGWDPRPRDFPRRNRLISGMSLGVVLVEAARRSGSLHTARYALEQGREVFAVPGSPLDPRAEGTNHLIKTGAALVTGAEDVLSVVGPLVGRGAPPAPVIAEIAEDALASPPDSAPDLGDRGRQAVLAALGPTPAAIDDLVRHSGLRPAEVQLVLLELDLAGRLERHGGQLVSLA